MSWGTPNPVSKVILVGDSGVGKTSLISSYINQIAVLEERPTVSPSSLTQTVQLGKGKAIDLQIWDTAGQERFRSISVMFYREADLALICTESKDMKEDNVIQWMRMVTEQVPDCKMLLVGTKSDLLDTTGSDEALNTGNEYAHKLEMEDFKLTSAKSKQSINELFRTVAEICYDTKKHTAPQTEKIGNPRNSNSGCPC